MLSRTSHPTQEKMIATLSRKAKPKSQKKKKKSQFCQRKTTREKKKTSTLLQRQLSSLSNPNLSEEKELNSQGEKNTTFPRKKENATPSLCQKRKTTNSSCRTNVLLRSSTFVEFRCSLHLLATADQLDQFPQDPVLPLQTFRRL